MTRILLPALAAGLVLVVAPSGPDAGSTALAASRGPAGGDLHTDGAIDPSFADDIMPIFEESCVSCHGEPDESGFPYTEAGLSLMSYEDLMKGSEFGSVIEPGNPDDSYLLEMVANGDMPDEGDPLTVEQIELIRAWIEAGAENN
jgi:mono/diheme cytochrome c family protein